MKTKTTFVKITVLILIGFVFLIGYKPLKLAEAGEIKKAGIHFFHSQAISAGEAHQLIDRYHQMGPWRDFDGGLFFSNDAIEQIVASRPEQIAFEFAFTNGKTHIVAFPLHDGQSPGNPQGPIFSNVFGQIQANVAINGMSAFQTNFNPTGSPRRFGFSFTTSHIEEIVFQNHSKINGSRADYLGIFLGHDGAQIHMIAEGLKGNRPMEDGDDGGFNDEFLAPASIYDKASPCPPCQ
ncbi:MAG TPA: hypothetical protein VGI43_19965 [Mucilaginibacter sp.]|jgi:hypothetical protein